MKKLNSFYVLGTTGIIIMAILQMFLALVLNVEETFNSFMPLYLVWLTFLTIGTAQLFKTAKVSKK